MRVGGDAPHFMRAPRAYRKRCDLVPAATAASAGDLRALLAEFDTSLCRYLLSPQSRVQFGATRRGSSVSAGGWHRRVRCSVRRCSLAVSGHRSGAAKPAKRHDDHRQRWWSDRFIGTIHAGGHMREFSLYSRTPDFRHRKTERRLIPCRQTLGAFVSSNRRGRHGRSRS
jgi:hypothetical protein